MSLSFEAEWERLDSGSPQERACFAAIGIQARGVWLTEADDAFVRRVREKVHLSAYRLAEWLAWNWWRLRWEPNTRRPDWPFAHRLSTIGGGYVWPNITVISDGERVALVSRPTQSSPAEPLRYISSIAAFFHAHEFEDAVDRFLDQVCGQLQAEGVVDTNAERIWRDVQEERHDPIAAQWRRLEALLGFDPGEAQTEIVERLVAEASSLGSLAVNELAAAALAETFSREKLRDVARICGFDAASHRVTSLPASALPSIGQVPAWRRGVEAAQLLRAKERLGTNPLDNANLTDLAGVEARSLTDQQVGPALAYALSDHSSHRRLVFRSKWLTGRRFELARLLGDDLAGIGAQEPLRPATSASTYRQKFQRSFAAELLCPFALAEEMLAGDYSAESLEDVAQHFHVSEHVVRTHLINHGRAEREDLEGDLEAMAV